MKKILAILLAALMVMAMTVAMASGDTGDSGSTTTVDIAESQDLKGADASVATNSFKLTKNYPTTGANAVTPADTLTFTVSAGTFANPGAVAPDPVPAITVADVDVAQGAKSADITVALPAYTVPGTYSYTITENDTNKAGVTYNTNTMYVVVTVENKVVDNSIVVGQYVISGIAVHSGAADGEKIDKFNNNYDSGTLGISKTVTGNLGDTNKVWNFTVTLTAPEGDTVNAPITIAAGSTYESLKESEAEVPTTGIAANWTGTKELALQLKHGQTITFENLPAGVTYTVVEKEANQDGYTTTETFSDTEKKIAGDDTDTVSYVNDKTSTVDTGINMTTLPYVLIAALAIAGAAIMMIRRRRAIED